MTFNKKMAVLLLPLMIAACGGDEQAQDGTTEGASEAANTSTDSGGSTGAIPASPSGEPWNAEQQDAYIQCLQQNRVVAMAWDQIEKKCVDQINQASQGLPE